MEGLMKGVGFGGWLMVLAAAAGLFPIACANPPKPFVYESDRELQPGPGLFSGEDGMFVIYGKSEDPEPAESAEDMEPTVSVEDSGAAGAGSEAPPKQKP